MPALLTLCLPRVLKAMKHDVLFTLRGIFQKNIIELATCAGNHSAPAMPSTSEVQACSSALVSGIECLPCKCVRLRYNVPLDPEDEEVEEFDVDEIFALLELFESHVSCSACTTITRA